MSHNWHPLHDDIMTEYDKRLCFCARCVPGLRQEEIGPRLTAEGIIIKQSVIAESKLIVNIFLLP